MNFLTSASVKIILFLKDFLLISIIGISQESDDFFYWIVITLIPMSFVGNGIQVLVNKKINDNQYNNNIEIKFIFVNLITAVLWFYICEFFYNFENNILTFILLFLSLFTRYYYGVLNAFNKIKVSLLLPAVSGLFFLLLIYIERFTNLLLYENFVLSVFLELLILRYLSYKNLKFRYRKKDEKDNNFIIILFMYSLSGVLPSLYIMTEANLLKNIQEGFYTNFLLTIKFPLAIISIITSVISITSFNNAKKLSNDVIYLKRNILYLLNISIFFVILIFLTMDLQLFLLTNYLSYGTDFYSFYEENIIVLSLLIPLQILSLFFWRIIQSYFTPIKQAIFPNLIALCQIVFLLILAQYINVIKLIVLLNSINLMLYAIIYAKRKNFSSNACL